MANKKKIDKKVKNNSYDRLKKFFKIGINSQEKTKDIITPMEIKKNKKTGKEELYPVEFPDRIKELYNYFLKSNTDKADSIKNRLQRYKDLSYMRYNSSIIGRAVKMYAFETTQADSQNLIINVISKDKKFTQYALDFFKEIGITEQLLTDVAYNLALFGDAFLINKIGENGIEKIIPISPFSVIERIEFNASIIAEQKNTKGSNSAYTYLQKNYNNLEFLSNLIVNNDKDYTKFFDTYLFGYELQGGIVLPPWGLTHFRLFSSESEFYPFGRSLFIESLSSFRNLKSLETLQQMARVLNFPTEIFEVQTDETMTQIEKWKAINEAREEYLNLNLVSEANKEDPSVGRMIWTATDLLNYRMEVPNFDLNQIADIEMVKENLVSSTDIPISFLVPDKGSFGTSGISLLQQYKPFARTVYSIQTAILEELILLLKEHLLITNDYDVNTPFELEMRYPVLEDSSDRQRAKSDNLRMINDIIDSITTALGLDRGEILPPNIIIDIFSKYSFLDTQDILRWFQTLGKEYGAEINNEKISIQEKSLNFSIPYIIEKNKNTLSEQVYKKLKQRLNEEVLLEIYFDIKEKYQYEEGIKNLKHFMSSKFVNQQKGHDTIIKILDPEFINKNKELLEKEKKKKK